MLPGIELRTLHTKGCALTNYATLVLSACLRVMSILWKVKQRE